MSIIGRTPENAGFPKNIIFYFRVDTDLHCLSLINQVLDKLAGSRLERDANSAYHLFLWLCLIVFVCLSL